MTFQDSSRQMPPQASASPPGYFVNVLHFISLILVK
jgi:hypothetical protein